MSVLEAASIEFSFGGVHALKGVSVRVEAGAIFAIVGPNGAGKTTLFNVITGLYHAGAGAVLIDGVDVTRFAPFELARLGLARTFQNLQIFYRMSVVENVMVGRHLHETTTWLSDLFGAPRVARQNAASRRDALGILERVCLSHRADDVASHLSYGELKRLEIARALAMRPKLLLLDEPAAGCNATETNEIEELIRSVRNQGTAVVLIEHDMGLVMSVSDRILVLDQGRALAEGAPSAIRDNPAVLAAYLGKSDARTETRHAAS